YIIILFYFVFFFQAEDGIRDRNVTGVQTCALPIYARAGVDDGRVEPAGDVNGVRDARRPAPGGGRVDSLGRRRHRTDLLRRSARSEERRVGKECRSRWSPDH